MASSFSLMARAFSRRPTSSSRSNNSFSRRAIFSEGDSASVIEISDGGSKSMAILNIEYVDGDLCLCRIGL